MSKIDTQVRHVTKPGANLFAELGFSPDDARRYQAESRERIDHTLALKEQLMEELAARGGRDARVVGEIVAGELPSVTYVNLS